MKPRARRIVLVTVAAGCMVSTVLTLGCANPGVYWKSRGLDLWDIVPTAVQMQLGLSASIRVTPFAQTGLGWYAVNADESANTWGMSVGRWGSAWHEAAVHLLIFSNEYHAMDGTTWPGGPDRRYHHIENGRSTRRSGNVFVILPGPATDPPMGFPTLPEWHGFLDSEVHVLIGIVGLRLGLAPAQLVDFFLGFFGLDLLGDDAKPRTGGDSKDASNTKSSPEPRAST